MKNRYVGDSFESMLFQQNISNIQALEKNKKDKTF